MNDPEVQAAMAMGPAMAANGAWATNDPEHMATYSLVAQYALDQAAEAVTDARADVAEAGADEH